jgi:DNA-binding GntR family transcriptional regulator
MNSVIRATLSDQAYEELRSRILSGALPGGKRLLPEELAVNLAISQTPIKEALLRLEADGLVSSENRKGAVVRLFTIADVEELYEARMLIEMNAIGQLFEKSAIHPELIAELSRSLDTHEFYARRGTLDDITTALVHDRKFHSALMTAAGNRLVCEWHQRILGQTHTVFVYLAGDYSRSADEHHDILDALKAGSVDQAREALRLHLLHSRDNALENVRRSKLDDTKEP